MSLNPRNLYLDFQEAANNFDCDFKESGLFIMSSRPRGRMVPSEAKNHEVSAKPSAVAAKKKESQKDKDKQRENRRSRKEARSATVAAVLAEKPAEDASDEEVDELMANVTQDSENEVDGSDGETVREEDGLHFPSNSFEDTSPDSARGRMDAYKKVLERLGKGKDVEDLRTWVKLAHATERTYQETLARYAADLAKCTDEIKKLKKEIALCSVVTPGLVKVKERKARDSMTREQRQMMNEVAHVVRSIVIRGVKFPFRGWNEYSDKPGTVCSMVMKAISFPPMSTDQEKKLIYVNFVQGLMPRMLTQSRNLITQHMRGQFNGEMVFVFLELWHYLTNIRT